MTTPSIPDPAPVPSCASSTPAAAPFLTARQLAAALGVSRRTITTWDQRRIIPSLCVGRVRRYELEEVSTALRAHGQPPAPASSSSSYSDSSSPDSTTATPAACALRKDNEDGKSPKHTAL